LKPELLLLLSEDYYQALAVVAHQLDRLLGPELARHLSEAELLER
jgi:hypothetical protein